MIKKYFDIHIYYNRSSLGYPIKQKVYIIRQVNDVKIKADRIEYKNADNERCLVFIDMEILNEITID